MKKSDHLHHFAQSGYLKRRSISAIEPDYYITGIEIDLKETCKEQGCKRTLGAIMVDVKDNQYKKDHAVKAQKHDTESRESFLSRLTGLIS